MASRHVGSNKAEVIDNCIQSQWQSTQAGVWQFLANLHCHNHRIWYIANYDDCEGEATQNVDAIRLP